MFSTLKHIFSKASEPVRAIIYGADHYADIIQDEHERRRIGQNKFITSGTQFVSSILLWASTLPFDHVVKQSLLYWSKPALVMGLIYAIPLSLEFMKYGREGLARQQRLSDLTTPRTYKGP